MLDRFVPAPRIIEIDHVDLAVPPDKAYALTRHFDLGKVPLVRMLFSLRMIPERIKGHEKEALHLSFDEIGASQGPGFRMLEDLPNSGFVIGAIGKFWQPDIPYADVIPEAFATFGEPGYARVAWAMSFLPYGTDGTRVVLELRLDATSEDAWQKVRRYYRLIGPFSHFIRRHVLSLLAEQLGDFESAEQKRALHGDEFIVNPKATVTHGITMDARPDKVWPWLLQLGCNRGGWYSYDVLDNAGHHSAREIVPDLQNLRVGDVLAATPESKDGFTVLHIEPERALVLGSNLPHWNSTWAFVLTPLNDIQTRLTVRARADYDDTTMHLRALGIAPIHHFMQTEQLRNLKLRAEGQVPKVEDNLHDVGEGIVGAFGMLASLATPFLRKHRSHWGIDETTANRALPGDHLVESPRWSFTHGVEIAAPAEAVWPWVVQIGQDKAGFYSYQWLENLIGCEIQNADRIHPEWQLLKSGDPLRLHKKGPPLAIAALEPGRWFVATNMLEAEPVATRVSWLFFIEPLTLTSCRLLSRYRVTYGDDLRSRALFNPALSEPVSFVMDRRMLLGIKERAERPR